MRRLWILGAVALAAAAPASAPVSINVGGRTVAESDGSMRFGWPALYFEQRFRGDGVHAMIETKTELFRLMIDGVERARLGPDKKSVYLGLPFGEHVARLEKLTESQSGSSRLVYLGPQRGGTILEWRARKRRIEFIGDSHSAGYGNTSSTRTCTPQEVHDTTDTQQAFGPLVAKRLDADYRVNAYSGAGIVRNYNGVAPEQNLPILYGRAIPGEADSVANDDGWHPQLIVIKLGSNDFSTSLNPDERWKDPAALHADYRTSYSKFLGMLIARHPQARFILMAGDPFYEDVEAVSKGSGKPVTVIRTVQMELTGCDWHPSLKDHVAMADQVSGAIAKLPGLWD